MRGAELTEALRDKKRFRVLERIAAGRRILVGEGWLRQPSATASNLAASQGIGGVNAGAVCDFSIVSANWGVKVQALYHREREHQRRDHEPDRHSRRED